jgi:hypothetical protein
VKPPAPAILLFLSYVGFVSLGLPDTVLGAAWPAMRAEFGLPLDAAGAAVLVTTGDVVLSSTASGWLRTHVSAGLVLSGSTILAAFALIASGLAPLWSLLLMAAGCAGLRSRRSTRSRCTTHRADSRALRVGDWSVGRSLRRPSVSRACLGCSVRSRSGRKRRDGDSCGSSYWNLELL